MGCVRKWLEFRVALEGICSWLSLDRGGNSWAVNVKVGCLAGSVDSVVIGGGASMARVGGVSSKSPVGRGLWFGSDVISSIPPSS